jgi:hypothetical protein
MVMLDVSRFPEFVSVKAVGLSSNGKIQANDSNVCSLVSLKCASSYVVLRCVSAVDWC